MAEKARAHSALRSPATAPAPPLAQSTPLEGASGEGPQQQQQQLRKSWHALEEGARQAEARRGDAPPRTLATPQSLSLRRRLAALSSRLHSSEAAAPRGGDATPRPAAGLVRPPGLQIPPDNCQAPAAGQSPLPATPVFSRGWQGQQLELVSSFEAVASSIEARLGGRGDGDASPQGQQQQGGGPSVEAALASLPPAVQAHLSQALDAACGAGDAVPALGPWAALPSPDPETTVDAALLARVAGFAALALAVATAEAALAARCAPVLGLGGGARPAQPPRPGPGRAGEAQRAAAAPNPVRLLGTYLTARALAPISALRYNRWSAMASAGGSGVAALASWMAVAPVRAARLPGWRRAPAAANEEEVEQI